MPGKNKGKNPPAKETSDFKFELNKDTQAALLPLMQQKVGELIGTDSGYLETLPKSVQLRIKALKNIQKQNDKIQEEFEAEIKKLELKFDGLKDKLYVERSKIVTGQREPTAEELVSEEETKSENTKSENTEQDDVKGIPEFWFLAFQHHPEFESMIQPHDEPIMKCITDVRIIFPSTENHDTFAIVFDFSKNDFFTNTSLTKTYTIESDEGEPMLSKIESTPIAWKEGKNITVKKVKQTQKPRGGRGGRRGGKEGPAKIVEVAADSFFHFFDELPGMEEADEEGQEILEQDYDIGMLIRTQIIEDAVMYFTGEVPTMEMDDGEDDENDDEDDDEDDEEDDDDEEEVTQSKKKPMKKAAIKSGDDADNAAGDKPQECKQQ